MDSAHEATVNKTSTGASTGERDDDKVNETQQGPRSAIEGHKRELRSRYSNATPNMAKSTSTAGL